LADSRRAITAPLQLRILAYITIFGGVLAAIQTILSLAYGHHLFLNFGIIGIWMGLGLLRGDKRWRQWTAVLAWIGWLGALIGGVIGTWIFAHATPTSSLAFWFAFVEAVIFLYSIWTIWVLGRHADFFEP
jgi:hypothetical protein